MNKRIQDSDDARDAIQAIDRETKRIGSIKEIHGSQELCDQLVRIQERIVVAVQNFVVQERVTMDFPLEILLHILSLLAGRVDRCHFGADGNVFTRVHERERWDQPNCRSFTRLRLVNKTWATLIGKLIAVVHTPQFYTPICDDALAAAFPNAYMFRVETPNCNSFRNKGISERNRRLMHAKTCERFAKNRSNLVVVQNYGHRKTDPQIDMSHAIRHPLSSIVSDKILTAGQMVWAAPDGNKWGVIRVWKDSLCSVQQGATNVYYNVNKPDVRETSAANINLAMLARSAKWTDFWVKEHDLVYFNACKVFDHLGRSCTVHVTDCIFTATFEKAITMQWKSSWPIRVVVHIKKHLAETVATSPLFDVSVTTDAELWIDCRELDLRTKICDHIKKN